jgi:hypothetical protein
VCDIAQNAGDALVELNQRGTTKRAAVAVGRDTYKILNADAGLERVSAPGEALTCKVCGGDNGGLFDDLALTIEPGSGRSLRIHDAQHETAHFINGRYKVQAGNTTGLVGEGGFRSGPPGLPHAFVKLSEDSGTCVLTYTPGSCQNFVSDFGPVVRSFEGPPIPRCQAPIFDRGPIFDRHAWRVMRELRRAR